jgi:hypothetical protein
MSKLENVLNRQKEGAKFVLSAQMLGMEIDDFETVVKAWCEGGGPGFSVVGVPHRAFVDGRFVISRVTVMKTTLASS